MIFIHWSIDTPQYNDLPCGAASCANIARANINYATAWLASNAIKTDDLKRENDVEENIASFILLDIFGSIMVCKYIQGVPLRMP